MRLYLLYCEYCNYKKITDGTDIKLFELPNSPIPGGYPKLDPLTNKTINPKEVKRPKKFRCPKCGRAVIAKKIEDPQGSLDEKLKIEESLKERAEREKEANERKVAYGKNWLDGDQDRS